jgi:anti-sigma factor RsiW
MSCSSLNLRDYLFGELSTDDRRVVDLHLADCARCREELDSLDATQRVLMSVREEEPPRRIAFVSDKVFEPTWWQRFWSSGRVGFASAAMLSMAVLAHGYLARPVVVTSTVAPVAQVDEAKIEAEVAKRVEEIVTASELRQRAEIQKVVARQKEMEFDYKANMLSVADNYKLLRLSVDPYLSQRAGLSGGGQ